MVDDFLDFLPYNKAELRDHGYRERRDPLVIAEHSASRSDPVWMIPWVDVRQST